MKKMGFTMGLVIDLVIALAFIVVTSLVVAGLGNKGLYISMVILAILMFVITLTLLIAYLSPNRRRSGDPE